MKRIKVVGIFFIIFGFFFAITGAMKFITALEEADERIYTTATIVRIKEYKTSDPDDPVRHDTYVEFTLDGKQTERKLNTYRTGFKPGKEIEIYYFDDEINTEEKIVYEKGSENFLILFPIVGTAFAILGAFFVFNKKLQDFLLNTQGRRFLEVT